jgi:hypothetical protein
MEELFETQHIPRLVSTGVIDAINQREMMTSYISNTSVGQESLMALPTTVRQHWQQSLT